MKRKWRISGVVLAAGPSSRFGGEVPKQLFEIDGEPQVRRAARTALESGLTEVIVVVGHEAPRVRQAVEDLAVRVVENLDYREGQSTSVKAGLAAIDPASTAAVFIPVDQPFLHPAVLDRILASYLQTGGPIVVPAFEGRRGAPVLFDRSLFSELAEIEGDAGGRQLFPRHPEKIVEVELVEARSLMDLDSLGDLTALRSCQMSDGLQGLASRGETSWRSMKWRKDWIR